MIDKRVVRGSTHAAMVIPAGTYPDALFNGTGKQRTTKRTTKNNVGLLWKCYKYDTINE